MHKLNWPPDARSGTALIVDLESRSLYEVCKAFRDVGYRTCGATSFAEAKRFLIAESPQILVADVRLGEFNGIQLLMLARELRPNIAVVITNAVSDSVLAEETRRMGGIFMVKPFAPHELLDAVRVGSSPPLQDGQDDRRKADRRVLLMPNFTPDRRLADRRKA